MFFSISFSLFRCTIHFFGSFGSHSARVTSHSSCLHPRGGTWEYFFEVEQRGYLVLVLAQQLLQRVRHDLRVVGSHHTAHPHTRTHTCTQMTINASIRTVNRTDLLPWTCKNVLSLHFTHACIHTCVCAYTYACAYIHACVHTYMRACMHTHMCASMQCCPAMHT